MTTAAVLPNPFPSSAVAYLSGSEGDFWSIETDALRSARMQLNAFLAQADSDKPKGAIMAIVGDYGTGKTHIAQDMLRQIYAANQPTLHPMYLDAPSDTFLGLYQQRFIPRLDRREVLSRIDEYYADIVAAELASSPLTERTAKDLRSREVSADQVVKTFGLPESSFTRELHKRLKTVTKRPDFGTALLLLRRPEFEAAVWEWLAGAPPDATLVERGIERQINDDAIALEAIGVMAHLFGQQGHHFILFIDEIEKVLSHTAKHQPSEAAVLALKKLMETVSRAGALLVLIGLPEFQEFLPPDANQRISAVIKPSAMPAAEIERYIKEAQKRAGGKARLEPFTKDSIDYLAEIAGGNARRMVRLCYHGFVAANDAKGPLTRALLREIAREQFELTSLEDVSLEITRTIESRGWRYETAKAAASDTKGQSKADFWLPVGEAGAGIALVVTRSLLHEADIKPVETLSQRFKARSNAKTPVEVLAVVNGYVADNLQQRLRKAAEKVVIFRSRQFREDLDSTLTGVRTRLEQADRENVLATVHEKVNELSRQAGSMMHMLEQVSSVSHPQYLQSTVAAGLRGVFGAMASGSLAGALPSDVSAVYDRVLRELEDFAPIDLLFNELFAVSGSHLPDDMHESTRGLDFLTGRADPQPLATIVILREAIHAFRRAIERAVDHADRRVDMNRVGSLCQMWDNFYARRRHTLLEARDLMRSFGVASGPRVDPSRIEDLLFRLGRHVYEACREVERRPLL